MSKTKGLYNIAHTEAAPNFIMAGRGTCLKCRMQVNYNFFGPTNQPGLVGYALSPNYNVRG